MGNLLLIKASGGIRTFKDAKEMIEAGASRIGYKFFLFIFLLKILRYKFKCFYYERKLFIKKIFIYYFE